MSGKPSTMTAAAKEALRVRATKHGLSYTPEYRAWQQMLRRCTVPTHPSYARYGGRGIVVCERWLVVENFIADVGKRPEGHELDRRDNDGPYSPENCRWVTRKVNDRNRSSNHFVEWSGERLTVVEWAERLGLGVDTLAWRLKRWPLEKAMTAARMNRGPVRGAKAARRAA